MKNKQIKESVKEKYTQIALQSDSTSCCGGSSCCSGGDYTVFSESYDELQGYNADADLGLGCGIPTEYAALQTGHHVLDLGSGAGNDCFVARASVGEEGHVTGLDFSEAMIEKAGRNASRAGYNNVEFVKGDIEEMPFKNESFDVVLSNCVLNLVPDKQRAFTEILRVLKPGGHFCISDVVLRGELPQKLQQDAEMYAGCVSGALQADKYMQIVKEAGFVDIKIHKQRKIEIPRELLLRHLNEQELQQFRDSSFGLFSITVKAFKSIHL